jgi:hypothetical protein
MSSVISSVVDPGRLALARVTIISSPELVRSCSGPDTISRKAESKEVTLHFLLPSEFVGTLSVIIDPSDTTRVLPIGTPESLGLGLEQLIATAVKTMHALTLR